MCISARTYGQQPQLVLLERPNEKSQDTNFYDDLYCFGKQFSAQM